MNPVHIAPLTALSTARRARMARHARMARRALLPLVVGSCALPMVNANAQSAPSASAQRAKATAAQTPPIVLAPAAIATPPQLSVRAINRAIAQKNAASIALSAPTSQVPTITASAQMTPETQPISQAPVVATDAPTAAPVVANAPVVPSVRLAQLRPRDTDAPATPRETGPEGLKVPIGPEVPIKGTPASPPPDTTTPPPRVNNPTFGNPVFGTSPTRPTIIGNVNAAEGREISEVRVVGNRVVPAETILARVRLQRGAAFSSNLANSDMALIDQLGFFSSIQVQVTPDLGDPDKVSVTYIVVENRVVTGFEFLNNTSLKPEEITPVLTSKVGTLLNLNSVSTDVNAIQKLYQDKGFAVVVQSGGVNQTEDGRLVFDLSEATISAVNIIGLKKTNESLVRRQIRIKAGDTFNATRMRQDVNRLYDTNFFDAVEPRPEDDPNQVGAIIVNFVFREKRTGQFQVGVGFDSRSKLSGFFTLSESNLRGTGQRGFASIEAGAQRNFELGTGNPFIGDKNASYDVSIYRRSIFRQPNSINRLVNSGVDGPIRDSAGNIIEVPNNSTLQEQRTGGRINFTRPLDFDRRRTLIFGYRNERAQASIRSFNGSVLGGTPATPTDPTAPVDPATPINPDDAIGSLLSRGTVSAASIGFLRDSRDLRIDPSSGGRESIVLEQAFKFLGGNTNFTKFDLDLRRYFPVIAGDKVGAQAKLVVAGRLVLGRSVNQLPIFEQYYIGGTETVRGYNTEQQFGDNQLYGNLELRYRFQRAVTGVLFADTGSAYGGRFATGNDVNLLTSFGIGVRLVTPIGPIRLDYGIGKDGGRTHFGIGPTF